jgi:hypothetical protein
MDKEVALESDLTNDKQIRNTTDISIPARLSGRHCSDLSWHSRFGVGARIVTAKDELDAHQLIAAAIGCNVAWGVIDATLYVLGSLLLSEPACAFLSRAQKRAQRDRSLSRNPG